MALGNTRNVKKKKKNLFKIVCVKKLKLGGWLNCKRFLEVSIGGDA